MNINNRPPLWILIYGLAIMVFGIFLVTIWSGIRIFLISIVIGLSLIAIWLYLDIRKEEKQKKGVYVNTTQACICLICDHKENKICLQQKMCMLYYNERECWLSTRFTEHWKDRR